ncbi:MAG: FAD-dependent oxidoreductase [Steroidobacteraceae bacterium]|uniref:FAD-dependent oxidoreductase n=1 Tax=Alcaligenes sp. SMD-FA TaxID=2991054 RepID=UPI0022274366|nr:FAD-dependent oxidoreductase [Alcaligenes sp. SMD-FA]UYY86322.1 FAD-dependent oxidoreductase [Alcaligenes sp. SMD-FA]
MKRLVLVGGGHAQLGVLFGLARARLSGVEAVLVTPSPYQYYSGMLPGWMIGGYDETECRIDLRPLAQMAGVRLALDHISGMDAQRRCVALSDGRHLDYDLLSLDVGSEIDVSWLGECGERLLPVKPLEAFYAAWPALVDKAMRASSFRLGVVGGGAAGVELALAVRQSLGGDSASRQIMLIAGERGVLPDHAPSVQRRVLRHLTAVGVAVLPHRAAGHSEGVVLDDGRLIALDAVIAANGASAPCWLQRAGIKLDAGGFVAVDAMHRSLSHPDVFAAGDVCARLDQPMARSGVHAVHCGPVMARNLIASLTGAALISYSPRRRSLYLLALGNSRAVMSWGRFSAEGAWVWRWKDHIDRRFIQRYSIESSLHKDEEV